MPKVTLTERIYNRVKTFIMDLVPKKSVGPIFKWIFKLPILQYKLGLMENRALHSLVDYHRAGERTATAHATRI